MSSDWEERRRESNRFLDRQQDRLDEERIAAERSRAFYEALLKRDHDEARRLAGVPPRGTGPGAAPPEQPEDLLAEIRELWERVSRNIKSRSLLPSSMTKDWYARLSDLTGPDCVERIEGVLQEAEEAYRHWRRYEDYREVSLSLDLEGHLHLIVLDLASLKEKVVRYLSQQQQ
jgi:hypothetical protein